MEAIYQQYKDQGFCLIDVITQNSSQQPATVADALNWKTTYGHTYPVIADPTVNMWTNQGPPRETSQVYWKYTNVSGVPEYVIVGRDRTVLYHGNGFNESAVRAVIEYGLTLNPGGH
jgi:hypothetical protein